jgi:hypothetical protein
MHTPADDVAGGFVEVIVEKLRKFEKLRPQDLIDHTLAAADHDGGGALAVLAEGCQIVAAAEGDEKLALPWVRQAELPIDGFLRSRAELGVEPFERIAGGLKRASTLRILSISSSRVMR